MARPRAGFTRFELRGRRSILARSGADFVCVAGAALLQGQVQISWQAPHFLTSGTDASQIPLARTRKAARAEFVAGAVFSQGQVQISWQGQHFRKVRNRRGSGSIFAGSSTCVVAGAAFSQGQVQISWQAQAISHGEVQISWQAQYFRDRRYDFIFCSCSSKIAEVKYKSSIRSTLSQLQLENWKVKYKSSFRSRYFDEASSIDS